MEGFKAAVQMRAYLIERGALPEIGEFVAAVKAQDAAKIRRLLTNTPALRRHIDRPLFHFGAQAIITAENSREIVDNLLEFGANINVRKDVQAVLRRYAARSVE